MNSEVVFVVEEAPEGGFAAHALGHAIVTDAESWPELHTNLREAVRVHFDDAERPRMIWIHFVRDETTAV